MDSPFWSDFYPLSMRMAYWKYTYFGLHCEEDSVYLASSPKPQRTKRLNHLWTHEQEIIGVGIGFNSGRRKFGVNRHFDAFAVNHHLERIFHPLQGQLAGDQSFGI
jgi:hypothetical protein